METFTFPVQTKPRGEVTFRRRVVQFGDGYSQKVGDGLNTKVQNWTLVFDGSFAEAEQVTDFLDRHKGTLPFLWTPPGKASPRAFTCARYSETPHIGAQKIITIYLDEDFQP